MRRVDPSPTAAARYPSMTRADSAYLIFWMTSNGAGIQCGWPTLAEAIAYGDAHHERRPHHVLDMRSHDLAYTWGA